MNRVGKAIISIVCVLILGFILLMAGFVVFMIVGQYHTADSEDGRLCFGYNKLRRNAFCYSCEWDGGDTSFTIPDECMGYPVTTLGGYIGRGFPCPFGVRVNTDEYNCGWDDRGFEYWYQEGDEYEILSFSIHLGAYVKEFDGIAGKEYLVNQTEKEDGEYEYDVIYKIVYSFTVDERNKTFYAEDGRLYYRSSGEMVEEFFYA